MLSQRHSKPIANAHWPLSGCLSRPIHETSVDRTPGRLRCLCSPRFALQLQITFDVERQVSSKHNGSNGSIVPVGRMEKPLFTVA